ncbi:hypothetical protein [Photobacterium toruni]|uniref:Uncharacterized protein n=1 Tax=Photobacterium toruni TaxID=1935446 RepID=A0A1T4UV20_9GAMM|nr:hypothetical protein [Photobacterium toruni]SKA56455.1 hypothetical protein CZ814_03757 [Photobacterium toruni]
MITTQLNKLLKKENLNGNLIIGNSYIIQWMPNIITKEKINIGVVFEEFNNRRKVIKMIDTYERISYMYSKKISFNLDIACELSEYHIRNNRLENKNLTEQINITKLGFTQGNNHNEIISNLYNNLIPLGIKLKERKKNTLVTKSRETIFKELNNDLKINLSLNYEKHVPVNNYLTVDDNIAYLPFKKENGAATLVSTIYVDNQRVKCNLFDGYQDIEIAKNIKENKNNAIFIALPKWSSESSKEKIIIENELDKFYWITKKRNIFVESNSNLKELSQKISNWCLDGIVA